MCSVPGTCRGPVARNTTPLLEKRLVQRIVGGRGGGEISAERERRTTVDGRP